MPKVKGSHRSPSVARYCTTGSRCPAAYATQELAALRKGKGRPREIAPATIWLDAPIAMKHPAQKMHISNGYDGSKASQKSKAIHPNAHMSVCRRKKSLAIIRVLSATLLAMRLPLVGFKALVQIKRNTLQPIAKLTA